MVAAITRILSGIFSADPTRSVQNVVEYTVNLCENEVVTVEDLPPSMRDRSGRMQAATEKKLLQIEEAGRS